MPSEWIERQIDELLLTMATTTGLLYARRRVRRLLPKVMIGGVALGLGAAVLAALAAVGVLGAAAGGTAWYRRRSKAVAPANGWKAPPATVGVNVN